MGGVPWGTLGHTFSLFVGYHFFDNFLGSLWIPFRIDVGTILASILELFLVIFSEPTDLVKIELPLQRELNS